MAPDDNLADLLANMTQTDAEAQINVTENLNPEYLGGDQDQVSTYANNPNSPLEVRQYDITLRTPPAATPLGSITISLDTNTHILQFSDLDTLLEVDMEPSQCPRPHAAAVRAMFGLLQTTHPDIAEYKVTYDSSIPGPDAEATEMALPAYMKP
jgi:hypothetical protein